MQDWERRVLASADLNVFVSAAMRDFYRQQYDLDGTTDAIVPCCVADEQFPDGKPALSVPGLPTKRPILAYLGTMAVWQCGEETLRLFAQLHRRDHRLFFLLLVPESDHPQARVLMARTGLPEASVLLTELPHGQIAAALQRAHAGVLLRRVHSVNRVASPTKFGEYLAAGLPVIMTDGVGDFSGMVAADRLGILLDPAVLDGDDYPSQEIDRIIKFVRRSATRRRQVAEQCRRIVRERLHWNAAAEALIRGYAAMPRIAG
jgi:glycosyltransferase involved in cell wall biosynthesis